MAYKFLESLKLHIARLDLGIQMMYQVSVSPFPDDVLCAGVWELKPSVLGDRRVQRGYGSHKELGVGGSLSITPVVCVCLCLCGGSRKFEKVT